jgi:hypothetical protein
MKTTKIFFTKRRLPLFGVVCFGLLFGLIWLAVAALEPTFASHADVSKTKLSLDDRVSIGSFMVMDKQGNMQVLGPARGSIVVPKSLTTLEANYALVLHPELLDRIPPDVLYGISCRNFDPVITPVIPHVARLTGLRRLEIHFCSLDDSAAEKLASLKNLTYLELSGCGITGPCLKEIKALPSIDTLSVVFNKLDPQYVHYLAEMPKLTNLYLDHTGLTDEALATIAKAGRVVRLGLSGDSKITRRSLSLLKSCRNLYLLDLRDDRLSAQDVLTLKGLSSLQDLRLPAYSESDKRLIREAFPSAAFENRLNVDEDLKDLFAPLH